MQHGISAAFALATWQFAVEGVDEGVSERSTKFGRHWFHVAHVHDTHPFQLHFADTEQYFLRPPGLLSVAFITRHHFQLHGGLSLVLIHLTMAKLYPQILNQRLSRVRSAEDVLALVDSLSDAFNCIHLETAFLSL